MEMNAATMGQVVVHVAARALWEEEGENIVIHYFPYPQSLRMTVALHQSSSHTLTNAIGLEVCSQPLLLGLRVIVCLPLSKPKDALMLLLQLQGEGRGGGEGKGGGGGWTRPYGESHGSWLTSRLLMHGLKIFSPCLEFVMHLMSCWQSLMKPERQFVCSRGESSTKLHTGSKMHTLSWCLHA